MQRYKFNHGFTLLELIVSMTVLAILLGIAVPSFMSTLDKRRLSGAAEQLYSDLQYARSEAIKRNTPVFVTFTGAGTTWCYGIATAVCTCTTANNCQLDGITKVVDQTGFRGVSLSDFTNVNFGPRRGTVAVNRTAEFTSNGRTVRVVTSQLGRVKMCSIAGAGYISGYPECPAN